MAEHHVDRVHSEPIVLDIGGDIGALIIYTNPDLRGREIEVSRKTTPAKRVHVEVLERLVNGETVFAAAYPELGAGEYHIWGEDGVAVDEVVITGGSVASLDWR